MTNGGKRYSLIPSRLGTVHAVYDQTIRRAFCDLSFLGTGLKAVRGEHVLPVVDLTGAKPFLPCADGLNEDDERRPGTGNPLLKHMAVLDRGAQR